MTTVVYPGGHFTHCVPRKDFHVLPKEVAGIFTIGPASFGKETCDYLLGGKLVCMSSETVCAIGTVVGLEDTDYGKSGFDGIDNDFSFNLLLAPFTPKHFWADAIAKTDRYVLRDRVADHAAQGQLIIDRLGTVTGLQARDPNGLSPVDGYGVLWRYPGANDPFAPWPGPGAAPVPEPAADPDSNRESNLFKLAAVVDGADVSIALPVLHCECEGSRIWAVCTALAPFLDILSGKLPGVPGPSVTEICHDALGWIPIVGDIVCAVAEAIVDVAMLPVVLAALAAAGVAWVGAQGYDDLFLTGPVKKQIKIGQTVVVQGRWCWDSGHAGHMELHPVVAIAIADGVPGDGADLDDPRVTDRVNDLARRWCGLLDSAPPPPAPDGTVRRPPVPGAELSPGQLATAAGQQLPENQWTVHPVIDGCSPREVIR